MTKTDGEKKFDAQVSDLIDNFEEYCGAACLLYIGTTGIGTTRGVRIEAPFIAKEFVDNVHFGRDPEGLLFYDSLDDFPTDSSKYKYYSYKNTEDPPALRIEFFKKDGDKDINFTTFVSKDTKGVPSKYFDSGTSQEGTGTWKDMKMASSYGELSKLTKGLQVTLTLKPIGKTLAFTLNDKAENKKHSIKATGTFTYPLLSDLTNSNDFVADFDTDRVVFYRKSKVNEMVGLFIASKPLPKFEGDDIVAAKFE